MISSAVVFALLVLNGYSFSLKNEFPKLLCSLNSSLFDFCNSIICEKITSCPGGNVKPNSSYCNCCEACINLKNEGSYCEEAVQDPRKYTKYSQCVSGLQCIENKCTVDISPSYCLSLKKQFENQRGKGLYSEELFIPKCDDEGFFEAKQRKNKKSICVSKLGGKLFGQEESDLSENMTCGCSRHLENLQKSQMGNFMTKPQEHCAHDGSFEELQCINNLCYCANTSTGDVKSKIVKKENINKLSCYQSKKGGDTYLLPCEKELQRTRSLIYQFIAKGIHVFGLEKVKCDPDGMFSPNQCDSEGCACTNQDGMVIRSYHTDDHNIQAKMRCDCARDAESLRIHSRYPDFNCNRYGSYVHLQCLNPEQCFCVDEDGEVISKFLDRSIADEEFCKSLIKNLTGKNVEFPLELTTISSTEEESSEDYDYYSS